MGLKYTAAELRKKNKSELAELIEAEGIELEDDALVGDYREALLEVEADDEVEEEEDDDPELPDEEEVDEIDEPEEAPKKSRTKKTRYTEGGKADNGEKLLGAKEVATSIGTDAKTLRQFFRSGKSETFTAVGPGGRYEFTESDVEKIKAEFTTWKASKPGRGSGGTSTGGSKRGRKAAPPAEVLEEVEEIEELEDLDELDEEDLEIEEED